jgi:hypothetical protein
MTGSVLKNFIEKKDHMFIELVREQGYVLEIANYDVKTGVRELFFAKVVNA